MNMNTKKDNSNLIYLSIVIGILVIIVITTLWADKHKENSQYSKLLEDYVVIKEDKDRQDMLIYDKETKIVYKCKYIDGGYGDDIFNISAYFASNGLPYRYNTESEEIEMIKQENENDN